MSLVATWEVLLFSVDYVNASICMSLTGRNVSGSDRESNFGSDPGPGQNSA